jgi:hypothetical protein
VFQQYIEELYEDFPACDDTSLSKHYQTEFSDRLLKTNFNTFAIYRQGLFEFLAEKQTKI